MDTKIFPKWMIQTLGGLLILFIFLLIINNVINMNGTPQTMRITATGKITAIPDMATVTIGVTSQGTNPVDVKNKNNQQTNQVIAFIKQQGIADKEIQTTGFHISPRYNYANGQNNIIGYQADQTVTVKINDIDKSQTQLEKIIDGAVNNGANEIQGIRFSFLDPNKLKQAARKQAIEKAKQEADELTSEANLTLGKIINVIPSPNDYPNPIAMINFSTQNKLIAPNIEPGSQDVTETLSVIFEIH